MKKKIASCLVAMFTFGILQAQTIFVDGKWEDLNARAKSAGKYLFVDCYTDWCGYCKLLDKNTFPDKNLAEIMNANFISTKVDMEKDYGINLSMKYHIRGFPTALVFNPDGKLVYRIVGYSEPKKYIENIKKALDPGTQENLKGVSTLVDLDFPRFYRDIFAGNGKSKWPDEKTVTGFLDQQKDLFSEVSWSVLATCNLNDKYRQFYLDNINKYRDLYGFEVEDKTINMMFDLLQTAIKEKSEPKFKTCLEETNKYLTEDKENILQSFSLTYYSETGNWVDFSVEFEKYLEASRYGNLDRINTYCWKVYEKCDNPAIISKACKWMKEATKKNSDYASVDTYASLLYKNKNYKEAERVANLAIKIGKDSGENVKETESLLAKIKADSGRK
jgi:thioredoxin-related protein